MKIQEVVDMSNENAVFHNTLFDLYERWQDEKDYEDINDYLTFMQESFPDFNIIKFLKRPFGVNCQCDDGKFRFYVVKQGSNLVFKGKRV